MFQRRPGDDPIGEANAFAHQVWTLGQGSSKRARRAMSNRVANGSSRASVEKEKKVDKTEKAVVVEDLGKVFADSGSVVVAHYTGMTVAEMSDLRTRMGAAGASFRVAKN